MYRSLKMPPSKPLGLLRNRPTPQSQPSSPRRLPTQKKQSIPVQNEDANHLWN
jgi:hypothetical protein